MFPRYLYPAVPLLVLSLIIIIAKTARNSCNQCRSHYLFLGRQHVHRISYLPPFAEIYKLSVIFHSSGI